MAEAEWLDLLLGVVIVASLLLILLSGASVGRKATDLEYQYAAGINGIRRIQSWMNIRTHTNRVLFGLAFMFSSIIGLTDLWTLQRPWIGRMIFLFVLLAFLYSAIRDWLADRKMVLMRIEMGRKQDDELRSLGHGVSERPGGLAHHIQSTVSESSDVGHGGPLPS
jgi:uncharacterized membrane protein YcjF (UPF0283 family)